MPANDASPTADREFVHSRLIDAPRDQVFAAFANPTRLARWWGPNGFTSTFSVFEFRSGGLWRFVMHGPDGTDYPNKSVFTEVVAPERIVLEHLSASHHFLLFITFEADGARTRVGWRQVFDTAAEKERIAAFVTPANEQNLDRLAAEVLRGSSMPPLITARLTLRTFTPDDAGFIVELLNDPGWLRFIGDRQVRTPDDARAYLRKGELAQAKHGFSLGAVQRNSDGALIGMCGLIRREGLDDVDLGYAFLPAYRGQGYAREAAAAWLACGFERLGLARIVAITTPDNVASGKVLEAIGMRFERRMRVAGHGEDSLLYAAQRAAWPATRPP
jgi:RimJ/RimL family protein N-acetyltransferase